MPGASSGEDLGVFDFVDDKAVERAEECALSRFAARANPNPSSITTFGGIGKSAFLQFFDTGVHQDSGGQGVGIQCVEIDGSDEEEVDHEAKREAAMVEADGEAPVAKDDNVVECALSRFAARANANPSSSGAGTLGGTDKSTFLQFHQDNGRHAVDESVEEEVDHEAKREAAMKEADGEAPMVKDDNEDVPHRYVEREALIEEDADEDGHMSSTSDTWAGTCRARDTITESSASEECLGETSFGTASFIPFVGDSKDDQLASERSDDEDETRRVLGAEDNGSWSSMSPDSSYDNAENGGYVDQLETKGYSTALEKVDMDSEVNISVEYFTYGDNYYGESQLTFLTDSIKVTCKHGSGDDCTPEFKWSIANLLLINCHWSQTVETALIEVRLKPTGINGCDESLDCSGALRLNFTVVGSQWVRKEQKITSLAPAYKNIWRTETDFNATVASDGLETLPLFSRQYISDDEAFFEDIIYPKGDPDAVCISRRDIELLKPETFLNDTIIDFYIKFLKDKINPDDRDKYHFFNSFFFRKLADLDKDRGCALDGRAAFLRVRKWTRKINIFGKDYIFIPVNFNLHWSLVVICHPGEIFGFEEVELSQHHRVPCILHMDSIKGSHHGLKNHIQSYLWEEWKERHSDNPDEGSEKFLNLRFVSLELPQQENSFDCGLFLLHYVELFLKEAPSNFNPLIIPETSHFLNFNWFIPAEASCKRFLIRELLYKLYRGEGINNFLSSMNNEPQSSVISMNNLEKDASSHGLQSCPSRPDMIEPAKHAVTGVDEQVRTSAFVNTMDDKVERLVSCQLLETGSTRISSDHISFRQIGLFGSSLNVIEEETEPLRCFNAQKDQDLNVNMETTPGLCLISLSINTATDVSQNQASNDVKNEDEGSMMGVAQVLVNSAVSQTTALVNSNITLSETEDLNCVAILEAADKLKLDSPRHSEEVPSGDDPRISSGEVPIETAIVEDSQEAGTTDLVVCPNRETGQQKRILQCNVQEPEKPHGSDLVESQAVEEEPKVIVEHSDNEETEASLTDCGELLENNDDLDASSHPVVVSADNLCPPLENDELEKNDEELCFVSEEEERQPAKRQKISSEETGRMRTRKYVK